MAKIYKVWIHIEEIDEDEDLFEDYGLPDSAGEFQTLEGAQEMRDRLLEVN